MKNKIKIFHNLIIVLTAEKILQHFLITLAFMGLFPGAGIPDIGPYFAISNSTMAILNLFYTLVFVTGLFAIIKQLSWGIPLIVAFASLDIVLESAFHGWLHITVSVIVSILLIIMIVLHKKVKKGYSI